MARPTLLDGSVVVPNGVSGDWRVETFTVSEDDSKLTAVMAAIHGRNNYVPTGNYKRLMIHADALTYAPLKGARYAAVWHDIWDFICGDNLEQMKALHRKYGRRADWQGSWCRAQCEMSR